MALPIIPALIAAARVAAVIGRGTLAMTGRGVAAAGRAASTAGRGTGSWGRRAAANAGESIASDVAMQNVQDFYSRARKRLGTARPTMRQYGQVAQDMRHEQEDREAEQAQREARERMMALGKSAAIVTGAFGTLAIASRDYTHKTLQRGDALRTFDGRIGDAMARYDVAELHRSFRTAQDTGGFTAAVVDARRQRADAWQPLNSQLQNFGDIGRVGWTKLQAWVGNVIDQIGVDDGLKLVNEYLAKLLGIELDKLNNENQHAAKTWLRIHGRMPTNELPGEGGLGAPPPGGGR